MMTTIAITARSLTFELDNEAPYFAPESNSVYINDKLVHGLWDKNILSLYGLQPATSYKVSIIGQATGDVHEIRVKTKSESVRLNVVKFGAVGDGLHLDSQAIQAAIAACPKDGTVWIPKGIYLCTPLFMKSHITLYLDEGAILLGHSERSYYPILPGYTLMTDESDDYYIGTWEGNPLDAYASLITALDVVDFTLAGQGIIDGNAHNSDWWVTPKIKRQAWRPRTLFMKDCSECLIQGVTVRNSPSWTIHPYLSEKLSFIDLKVMNPKNSPNTDGLDPESCRDLRIIGVDFSVGDDCIAIKSGKVYMGKKLKRASERFTIRNCRMRHGHGAVVIGSEVSAGAKDIEVSRCYFEETDRGLRIKTRRGRGEDGIIDNITFKQIKMKDVLTPFVMNMYYFCDPDGKTPYVWSREKMPVDEWTPCLGSFRFETIDCEGCQVSAGAFYGLPEQAIKEITMKDVVIKFAQVCEPGQAAMMSFAEDVSRQGIVAEFVDKLRLQDVSIQGFKGPRVSGNAGTEIIEIRKDRK